MNRKFVNILLVTGVCLIIAFASTAFATDENGGDTQIITDFPHDSCSGVADINGDEVVTIEDLKKLRETVLARAYWEPLNIFDIDGNCCINDADVVYLENFLEHNGRSPVNCSCANPIIGCVGRSATAGDADHSGEVNIGDVTFLVSFIFQGGKEPLNIAESDADGGGDTNIGDVTLLVGYIFQGGAEPVLKG